MNLSPSGQINRDFFLDVSLGLVPGYRRIILFGNNADVDAAEDIWSGGGDYPWMTGATSLEVVSDTAAGTGMRTLVISGLDASYAEVVQTIALNGTTPVAVPTQLFRINSSVIGSGGSGLVNAGTVLVRGAGGGTTRAIVSPGIGFLRQALYTAPAGHTFVITGITLSINRPSTIRDATVAVVFQDMTLSGKASSAEVCVASNPVHFPFQPGFIVLEKQDMYLRCTSVSATNTDLSAGFGGILKSNAAI